MKHIAMKHKAMKNNGTIALVLSGFPRRSETFALNEARALADQGLLAGIFATKPGDGLPPHPDTVSLLDQVTYLPDGTADEQAAALVVALNGKTVQGIHGYFAHQPAEIASLAARQMALPYGFSVHAKDARKVAPDTLMRRAESAVCVVACNEDVALDFKQAAPLVDILPHGVDTERFQPQPFAAGPTLNLLAVGRLVEKKGFDVLIEAVRHLTVPFRLRIVGEGTLRPQLQSQIREAGLEGVIELHPGMSHEELPGAYAQAHMVIVPSVVDQSGDRDGLPNVVLEAMASGRPVIASRVAAIPSAITHGQTGLLVAQREPLALASTIEALWQNPETVRAIGENARRRIKSEFDLAQCSNRFCQYITMKYGL